MVGMNVVIVVKVVKVVMVMIVMIVVIVVIVVRVVIASFFQTAGPACRQADRKTS